MVVAMYASAYHVCSDNKLSVLRQLRKRVDAERDLFWVDILPQMLNSNQCVFHSLIHSLADDLDAHYPVQSNGVTSTPLTPTPPQRTLLKKELDFDGTHLGPRYLRFGDRHV